MTLLTVTNAAWWLGRIRSFYDPRTINMLL